ncbi:plasmid mobilization relaxosome protein MobC [Bifidobacterium pullorum subsp. saeculare]|uniref:plasmid mobilization relaxosome protein MobC n=1 Tax=Bifidobacterium pullorum TaxID=78448 RepID=UPI0019592B84|nr:plasmid mobilization relaxosome protein MobC [Bifidobacterium pullorum]MBM6692032.1 plasmid mobilization relaxosome protein MobC [Bifidobacterium pullorum subsp. saeculare]
MARKQFHINGEPRRERIYIRVSGKEKEVIASVAKARDATISRTFLDLFRDEYLRIEREQMERDSPTVQELRRIRSEIWHIGHNINQIARLTNTELGATHEDVTAINDGLERCEQLLSRLDDLVAKEQLLHGTISESPSRPSPASH